MPKSPLLFFLGCSSPRESAELSTPPELFVVSPTTDTSVPEGTPTVLSVIVADAESAPTELTLRVEVADNEVASGAADKVGRYRTELVLPAGSWTARVVVVDPAGDTAEKEWVLNVVPPDLVPPQRPQVDGNEGGNTFVRIDGPLQQAGFGRHVAVAPDGDADGTADLLVGAPDRFGGAVFLFASSALVNADRLTANEAAASFLARDPVDGLGSAGGAVDDLDGDGFPELALGAPGNAANGAEAGVVWIVRGGTPLGLGGDPAELASWSLVGEPGDRLGTRVAGGDLDGDGLAELLVGAPGSDLGGAEAGVVAVFSGTDGARGGSLDLSDSAALLAGRPGDRLGTALAVCADADGDGTAELGIGAQHAGNGEARGAGSFQYVAGASLPAWAAATDAAWLNLVGDHAGDALGADFACPGDSDADGLGDTFVGAPGVDRAGADGGTVFALFGPGRAELTLAASEADARFDGPPGAGLGDRVSTGGDLDHDGLLDVIFGSPGGVGFVGFAHGARADHWGPGGSPLDASLPGNDTTGALGGALAGGFDLGRDGYGEVALGAPGADLGNGAVYVLSPR